MLLWVGLIQGLGAASTLVNRKWFQLTCLGLCPPQTLLGRGLPLFWSQPSALQPFPVARPPEGN